MIEVKWRESSRCPASTEQVEVSALAMTAKAELIVEHNLIPRPVGDPVNPGPVDVEIWLVGEDGEEVPESRKVVVEVQVRISIGNRADGKHWWGELIQVVPLVYLKIDPNT